jgi:hypothetical protein
MTVGDVKELFKSQLLEDHNELLLAVPEGDDERFETIDAQIEDYHAGRKVVFRLRT